MGLFGFRKLDELFFDQKKFRLLNIFKLSIIVTYRYVVYKYVNLIYFFKSKISCSNAPSKFKQLTLENLKGVT